MLKSEMIKRYHHKVKQLDKSSSTMEAYIGTTCAWRKSVKYQLTNIMKRKDESIVKYLGKKASVFYSLIIFM